MDERSREPIRLLFFSASLRAGSLNTRRATLAAAAIDANGGEVDLASMRDFDAPSYDSDLQDRDGFPTGTQEFRRHLEACDGYVIYPDMFSLAQAHAAFDDQGRIADYQPQARFETNIINFMDAVEAHKRYPCVKKAWVEYLGEHPEPMLDRVQS